jgi:hypothetical protein
MAARLGTRPSGGGHITTATSVGREYERAELSEAAPGPERGPEPQALIEGDGVQAIFDRGADADEPEAVVDEPAQVPRIGIWNPDSGEAVVLKEIEEMPGVAAISLRFSHNHGPDLGRFAQSLQECVKPQRVSSAFDAHRDGRWKRRVELLDGIGGVRELLLDHLPGLRVEYRHLLLSRMRIAADENHEFGLHAYDVVCPGFAEAINDAVPFS